MGRAIVFDTPGLIDIRAFTVMGINVKPATSNPIGFFGTGLKYAIAVLVCKGANPVLYIGLDRYEFYSKKVRFRGTELDFIWMKRNRWLPRIGKYSGRRYIELPYTTLLGKTWEMWQAFRELEANTRDEQGETFLKNPLHHLIPDPNRTRIVVENEEFVHAYFDRDKIFLPESLTQRSGSEEIQILDKPSQHVYYRGLRVYDLKKPSLYTYNLLSPHELTEDRTLKYEFSARSTLANHLTGGCTDESTITKVLRATDQSWEYKLDFDYVDSPPSDQFKKAFEKIRPQLVGSSAYRYYGGYVREEDKQALTLFEVHPLPWKASNNGGLYDLHGDLVMQCKSIQGYEPQQAAEEIAERLNAGRPFAVPSIGGKE